MNSDGINSPDVFPAYTDVVSGAAPFPDIPVISSAPLIIPPPDAGMTADGPPVSIQVRFGNVTITQGSDFFHLRRMIEEQERYQLRSMVDAVSSGIQN